VSNEEIEDMIKGELIIEENPLGHKIDPISETRIEP
jgi:hypothetical protein